MMKNCDDCLSRRKFLELSSKSISAVTLLGPVTSLLSSCSQEPLASGGGTGSTVTLPNSSNNVYTFDFTNYPSLQSTGGSVHAIVQATSGSKDVFVTRVSTSSVVTVSTTCTHQGCTLSSYDSSSQTYSCACHGSVFTSDGNVKVGPATTPLPSYPSTITSTGVQVTVT